MDRDYRKEIDDAVNAISEKLKLGALPRTSSNAEEDAANAVLNCITEKAIKTDGDHSVSTPVPAVEALDWAAKQYFVQLLKKRGAL